MGESRLRNIFVIQVSPTSKAIEMTHTKMMDDPNAQVAYEYSANYAVLTKEELENLIRAGLSALSKYCATENSKINIV